RRLRPRRGRRGSLAPPGGEDPRERARRAHRLKTGRSTPTLPSRRPRCAECNASQSAAALIRRELFLFLALILVALFVRGVFGLFRLALFLDVILVVLSAHQVLDLGRIADL